MTLSWTLGLRREHLMVEDITVRLLPQRELHVILGNVNSLGIENGHACKIKSLLGDFKSFRVRALPYFEDDRRLLILEFHPGKIKTKVGTADHRDPHRKGLLKRVVDHLDF